MIDEQVIMQAIATALHGQSEAFPRVLWDDTAETPERPFLAVSLVRGPVADDTLAQGLPVWTGFVIGAGVAPANGQERASMALGTAFGNLFAAGTRFAMSDGRKLLVNGQPEAIGGYRDGPDWRYPVRVPLITET